MFVCGEGGEYSREMEKIYGRICFQADKPAFT